MRTYDIARNQGSITTRNGNNSLENETVTRQIPYWSFPELTRLPSRFGPRGRGRAVSAREIKYWRSKNCAERTARIQIDLFLERNGYSANPIRKFSGTYKIFFSCRSGRQIRVATEWKKSHLETVACGRVCESFSNWTERRINKLYIKLVIILCFSIDIMCYLI